MKIISQRREYYDHLQFVYGQDEDVVWHRDMIFPKYDKLLYYSKPNSGHKDLIDDILKIPLRNHLINSVWCDDKSAILTIHVLGKVYPAIRHADGGCELLDERNVLKHLKLVGAYTRWFKGINAGRKKVIRTLKNIEAKYAMEFLAKAEKCEQVSELHEKLNIPIFQIVFPAYDDYHNRPYIPNKTPYLEKVKGLVGKLGSAEQIYQNIYNFFIRNRESADKVPPVVLDNKSKILKAGFDLKSSFRHPTK